MERQKSVAGIVPEDPLAALSSSSTTTTTTTTTAATTATMNDNTNGGGDGGGGNNSKRAVSDATTTRTSTSIMGASSQPTPQRSLSEAKSTDALLASFSAHTVDDNWLDEEYIEHMKLTQKEDLGELDLYEQDLLLDKQIKEWEKEDLDNSNGSDHDYGDPEPWDYYRPDGKVDQDEINDDEDQNSIKIDLIKGTHIFHQSSI